MNGGSFPLLLTYGDPLTRLSLAATSWADAAPPLLVLLSGVTHKDWTSLEEWPPPANSGAVTMSTHLTVGATPGFIFVQHLRGF